MRVCIFMLGIIHNIYLDGQFKFRFLSLTNTLTDKFEILMSSNGELDASNGTQQNDKEVRG